MKILFSTVGRRGYLVKYFRETLNGSDEIWGGDTNSYAPGFQYCDRRVIFPKVTDDGYVETILGFCVKNKIDMVIPLIDPELEVLAAERERFFEAGVMVVVSPLKTVEISFDKFLTYQFAKENGIAVPETVTTVEEAKELIKSGRLQWPLVVKARKGSASANITYCHNAAQLENAFETCPNPMVQQFVNGDEYGLDLFGDSQFKPVSVFCKKKLAMRAGETDKAVSTDDPVLIGFGKKVAESLEIFGPIDVDVIVDNNGPRLLEINPRFGGGYPCSHLAGANFPAKLIAMAKNEPLKCDIGSCPAGVCMLKQDEIVRFDPNLAKPASD